MQEKLQRKELAIWLHHRDSTCGSNEFIAHQQPKPTRTGNQFNPALPTHPPQPPFCHLLQKIWKKTWMVLFKPSDRGVGRVEFFTIGNRAYANYGKSKTPERKAVRLSDCLSITPAPEVSCPAACTAFYLQTTQCTYILASTASQQWLSALQLLTFQVSHISRAVQCSTSSSLCMMGSLIIWERWVNLIHERQIAQ